MNLSAKKFTPQFEVGQKITHQYQYPGNQRSAGVVTGIQTVLDPHLGVMYELKMADGELRTVSGRFIKKIAG